MFISATRLLALLALLVGSSGCTSCSDESFSSADRSRGELNSYTPYHDTSDLPAIVDRGELRILVPQRRDESLRRSTSTVRLERQMAAHFAERYGIAARWIPVATYEELIPMLVQGKGDVIAAQMTVTDMREEQVGFTRPVATVSELLIGKRGASDQPKTPEDLDGRTVHVTAGSSFLDSLLEIRANSAPRLKIVEIQAGSGDAEELAYDVSRGERTFTVIDSNSWENIKTYNADLEALFAIAEGRKLAWAVRRENPELKAAADAFLIEAALTGHTRQNFTGDLSGLRERGSLRVLTRNNAVSYYLHRGRQLGFDYELAAMVAKALGLRLEIVVPPARDLLIPWLIEGKGDLIAASMTVTPERAQLVRFSAPYLFVDEILVQRKAGPRAASVQDLAGKKIHVRQSSSYFDTLSRLKFATGVDFEITAAGEDLETEVLIDQVAAGEIDFTVADSHILHVEETIHDTIEGAFVLEPRDDAAVAERVGDAGQKSIAFALRPGSAELAKAVDDFVEATRRGLEYNLARKRYFNSQREINVADEERSAATGRISRYDQLIRRYAAEYGLDWRLMAAVAFQESRFDAEAKSWVGALGLFQVMPSTGRELGFENLLDPESSTHAGIKYIAWLIERFEPSLDFRQRVRFALASYNAGLGHVKDARRLAAELGLDPNRWFQNCEKAMLLLQKPQYYRRARYGYVRGAEPVKYVSEIQLRYDNYVELFPR